MTKIDIFSGFLGAGKTTLIKKLIKEAYGNEKIALIENEFGEIGIDGGFLKEAGIQINEMNSGCICCSLVGDFREALKQVLEQYHPDRILIEPTGVGKLSDVIRAVEGVVDENVKLNGFVTVADVSKCKMYMKNFGEFYNNQIEYASTIILSRTQNTTDEKMQAAVALLREHNAKAAIVTTPWDLLTGQQILSAIEGDNSLTEELMREAVEQHERDEEEHEHHHHDHDKDEHEHCHHHDHDENEHEHCHHHDHDEDEHEHCHHHDHDEHEHCHHDHDEHHHEHGECCHGHHHHHADDVFTSWGKETIKKYTKEEIEKILSALSDEEKYGTILRAKGIVAPADGTEWIHFDYVPSESNVRNGSADYTGRLCVIGANLNETALAELFSL